MASRLNRFADRKSAGTAQQQTRFVAHRPTGSYCHRAFVLLALILLLNFQTGCSSKTPVNKTAAQPTPAGAQPAAPGAASAAPVNAANPATAVPAAGTAQAPAQPVATPQPATGLQPIPGALPNPVASPLAPTAAMTTPSATAEKKEYKSNFQVDFSRDGRLAVSGGKNATIRLFDIDKGFLIRTFVGQKEPVSAIAFRQDATVIAAGSVEGKLTIWDAKSADGLDETERDAGGNEERVPLSGHVGPIRSLAFRPDGKEIATGGEDGTIRFWRLPVAVPESIWSANSSVVLVDVVPQSGKLIAAKSDGAVELWDLENQQPITLMPDCGRASTTLAVSEDGKFAACGDIGGHVRIADLESRKLLLDEAAHEGAVSAVRFHPKRSQLITIGTDGSTRTFDAGSNSSASNQTVIAALPSKSPRMMVVSHTGAYAAVAGTGGGTVDVVDVKDKKLLHSLSVDGKDIVSLAWTVEDRTLTAGSATGELYSWRMPTGQRLFETKLHDGPVRALAGSSIDGKVVSGGADGKLRLWNQPGAPEIVVADVSKSEATQVVVSPGGQKIAIGSADGTVRIIDAERKTTLGVYPPAGKSIVSLAWSSAGDWLAAAGSDKMIRVWNVTQGTGSLVVLETVDSVTQLAMHSNGPTLVAALANGEFQTWKLPIKKSRTLAGHPEAVTAVIGNRSGTQIITAANDRICRLFSVEGGDAIRTYEGAQDAIGSLVQSVEGDWIAAGDRSGQITSWSTDTGRVSGFIRTVDGAITSMSYDPVKKQLASSSVDGIIRVWQTPFSPSVELADAVQESVVLSISPNGRRVAIGLADFSIAVRDTRTGQQLQLLKGHAKAITALGWSIDSSLVVSGSLDETVSLWRVSDGQRVVKWEGHSSTPRAVSISGNGEELRAITPAGQVSGFTRATSQERVILPPSEGVKSLAVSPSGKRLLLASEDGSVRIVNCETGAIVGSTAAGEAIVALAWCGDDVTWVSLDAGRAVKYWKQATIESGKGWANGPRSVTRLCVSADGSRLLTGTPDGVLKLWDAAGNSLQAFPWENKGSIQTIGLSDDGQIIAAAGAEGAISLYQSSLVRAFTAHAGHAEQVRYVDDRTVVTAGEDKLIRAWNLADETEKRRFEGCPALVVDLVVSAANAKLFALGDDRKLYGWNLNDGSPLDLASVLGDMSVTRIGLSSDAQRLAILNNQGQIRIFGLAELRQIEEIASPAADATAIAYLKNGAIVCAADTVVNIAQGEEQKTGQKAHTGSIVGVAAISNKDEFITVGEDKKIKIWSINGDFIRDLAEAESPLVSFVLSDNGREMTAMGRDGKLFVWNFSGELVSQSTPGGRFKLLNYSGQTPSTIGTMTENQFRLFQSGKPKPISTINTQSKILTATINPDRRSIYAITSDGNLVRYGFEPLKVFDSGQKDVHSLALSKNGASLASAGDDSSISVWKLATFKPGAPLKGHSKPATALAFGRDEATVISMSSDKTVRTWNVTTSKQAQSISISAIPQSMSISPDFKLVAVATKEKAVSEFELQTGKPTQSVTTESSSILSAAYLAKGMIALDAEKQVCLVDTTVSRQFPQQSGELTGLELFKDGSYYVTAGPQTGVKLFDFTGKMIAEFETSQQSFKSVSISSDGLWLAGYNPEGSTANVLTIWNVADRKQPITIETPSPIRAARFELEGDNVIVIGEDRQMRRYRVTDRALLESIAMVEELRGNLVFHASGEILALERDDRVRLYQASLVHLIEAHKGGVTSLTYSNNGNLLFSGGADGRVVGWDAKTTKQGIEFQSPNAAVSNVHIAQNQQNLIVTYSDNAVRVWVIGKKTSEPDSIFQYKTPVNCASSSSDSSMMVSGGADKVIHLLLLADGRELVQFRGHEAAIRRVVISPDDKSVISFGDEDAIRVWKIPENAKTSTTIGQIDKSTGTVAMAQPQDAEIDRLMASLSAPGPTINVVEQQRQLDNLRNGRPNAAQAGAELEVGMQKIDREIQAVEKKMRQSIGQNKTKLRNQWTALNLQKRVANSTGANLEAAKKELEDFQSGKNPNPVVDPDLERPPGIDAALKTIRTEFTFDQQSMRPVKLAISPDKSTIAASRETYQAYMKQMPAVVYLWDTETGSLLRSWKEGQPLKISSLFFSTNEKVVLTAPDVSAYQVISGTTQVLTQAGSVAFSRNEPNLIAVGSASTGPNQLPILRFFDTNDMTFRPQSVPGFESTLTAMTFSGDGKRLYYCVRSSRTHQLYEREIDNPGSAEVVEEVEHTEPWNRLTTDGIGIETLLITTDGKFLVAVGHYGAGDFRVTVWTRGKDKKWAPNSKLSQKLTEPIVRDRDPSRVWLIKDRPLLCFEDNKRPVANVVVWDIANGKPVGTKPMIKSRDGRPETAHSEDGDWFVSGDDGGRLELLNLKDLKAQPVVYKAHQGQVVGLAISKDGERIISAGAENFIRVWERRNPQKVDSTKKKNK